MRNARAPIGGGTLLVITSLICLSVHADAASMKDATFGTVVVSERPITEQTLRTYFEVCHFALYNRRNLETQFQLQQQELPPWYPPDVWSETVKAVEAIDVVPIALPVYQKYFSEQAGVKAIRLFVTPQAQAVIKNLYEKELELMAAGDPAHVARSKALLAEREHEDATVRQILHSLTPKEKSEMYAFVRSPEWQRLNSLGDRIRREYNIPYVAEQQRVEREIAIRHKDELENARRQYETAHSQ